MIIRSLIVALAISFGIAYAQTPEQMAAFADGKAAGDNTHTQDIFNNIGHSQAGNVVSGYSQIPPPQSAYYGGQNTVLNSLYFGGQAKISECGAGTSSTNPADKEHCEAVNSLVNAQSFNANSQITRSDPLMLQGKAIAANPEAIAGAINGNYSNCTTTQQASTPDFVMQTCDDWSENGAASCTIGQNVVVDPDYLYSCKETISTINHGTCTYGDVVVVDVDYNYQCTKIEYQTNTHTCHKTLNIQINTIPGCTPGAFIVRVIADPCPYCIDYLVYDYYCQNGYYQQHFYTQVHGTNQFYVDLGWANIPGTPGAYIPQTQGITNMNTGAGYCFITYYSQTCNATTCTMGSWFYNPCLGFSYYGSANFSLPTQVTYTDVWNDQCATLNSRTY
ncbi:hypothetical protein [Sulfuricystis multivorans]|uniref:hypothetical protein n=1 Tax=Sulfuricystis multivorans TaxID=2211108 RepID=UPI000F8397FC|nr:hypothetical protein [Sulfuricystis multivorans]